MKKNILALFLILFVAACASQVTIKRTTPAKYNITGVKRIAFMPFTYTTTYLEKGSKAVSDHLEYALHKNGFFTIVETGEDRPLEMDEKISIAVIKKIGAKYEVDAVVTGELTGWSVIREEKEVEVEKEENGEKKIIKEPYVHKLADVSFTVDLIDTRTGKNLSPESYKGKGDQTAQGDQKVRALASDAKMLRGVLEGLAHKFVRDMTPHEVTEKIPFKNEKQCKEGVKAAKEGKWSEAKLVWGAVLSVNAKADCTLYNLGLALEVENNFKDAQTFYERAEKLAPADELYAAAVSRIKRKQGEQIRLIEQMKGR